MSQPAVLGMRPAAGQCPSVELEALAFAVARLVPSRHDPEQFFVTKSEIACNLRRLARTLRRPA